MDSIDRWLTSVDIVFILSQVKISERSAKLRIETGRANDSEGIRFQSRIISFGSPFKCLISGDGSRSREFFNLRDARRTKGGHRPQVIR